jgi:DmsE family decaheme c-type cytochrome
MRIFTQFYRVLIMSLLILFSAAALANSPTFLAKEDMGKCYKCHDDEEDRYTKAPHINTNCETCHAGAGEHLQVAKAKDAGIIPHMPDAMACQSCHENDHERMNWRFAEHHAAGLECSDCHGLHNPKAPPRLNSSLWRADKATQLCADCHQEVIARFNMRSSHPVKEGGASCVDCHNPHGSKQSALHAKTSQCTDCHQRVRGPHAFEHAPVTEDCATCHNPHGSPNAKLLNVSEPTLCLQCHSIAGNRHGQSGDRNNTQIISAAALRQCSSCHNQVHGSSHDEHLRY